MSRDTFVLLNLVALFLTQFGAVYVANFDSYFVTNPILVTLYDWAFLYLGFSPLLLLYLIAKKDQKMLFTYIGIILSIMTMLFASYPLLFPKAVPPSLLDTILGMYAGILLSLFTATYVMINPANFIKYVQTYPVFGVVELLILLLMVFFLCRIIRAKLTRE